MSNNKALSQQQVKYPIIIEVIDDDNKKNVHCLIPSDLIYFDGHFTDNPVLPGVVQIHWAEFYARQEWSFSGGFTHLEKVKFQKILVPNEKIEIMLTFDLTKNRVHFSYSSIKGMHSSGYICFSDE